jgi:23S rRNA (uracil1939-C5)-methyltransferase
MARQRDLCPHFGACGGCEYQDLAYAKQLKLKEADLAGLFSDYSRAAVKRIIPSPEIWCYRNKMEFAASADRENRRFLGLRQRKKFFKVVDLKECRIFYKDTGKILDAVRRWMTEYSVEPYHMSRHTGELRYMVVRHSKFYDEFMVIIVAASKDEAPDRKKFLKLAGHLKSIKAVRSVYLCLNSGLADVALNGDIFQIAGEDKIRERINGIDYLIYPEAFFQTNPYCCGKLYDLIKRYAKTSCGKALDIFCGTGGITLQIADSFREVIGVDNCAENIECAEENARLNKIKNARFVCCDAEEFVLNLKSEDSLEDFSVLIVDPPRAGLTKKTKAAIFESGVPRIIYVSCNPKNLSEDLKAAAESYRIKSITAVDMFPHTRHLEAVALLEKRGG